MKLAISDFEAVQINVDHKPSSTGLLSSHDTFSLTADPLTCISLKADMVFFLLIKNFFLDRFSFSLDEAEISLGSLSIDDVGSQGRSPEVIFLLSSAVAMDTLSVPDERSRRQRRIA